MHNKYNSLLIFDLDGVLIDSRSLHYNALNVAIFNVAGPDYIITVDEHLSRYDGLPTKQKLLMLTREKGLDAIHYDAIYNEKQAETKRLILQYTESQKLKDIMFFVNSMGYKIAVASNSIRETVKIAIHALGLTPYVDYYVSNEDVKKAKPHPEMYWKAMTELNAIPDTTVIIEDSHIGREGAIASGAQLLSVENPSDVTLELVVETLKQKENSRTKTNIKWNAKNLNVLIPMAGAGSRFQSAGYTFPKPLIEVNGRPMIQMVVDNLNMNAHFIFIVQKEHYEKYNLKYMLQLIAPGCDIVQVEGLTEGAACTTLLAEQYINSENPLVIANSDQFIEWNSNEAMYSFSADDIDGGILTFKSTHPKWSYAKLDERGFVSEIAEKKVISDNATVGVYYWKHGSDYVKYAKEMIVSNDRTNNEFYVAPTFNYAVKAGKKIKIKEIAAMYGTGTPEDLNYFLNNHKESK